MLATPYKRRTGVSFSALRGKRPDHPALALPSPVARALAHLAGTTAPPPGGHSPRRSLRNPHAPAFSGAISATSFHHRRPESSSMHLCHACVQLQQEILAYILERGASFLKLGSLSILAQLLETGGGVRCRGCRQVGNHSFQSMALGPNPTPIHGIDASRHSLTFPGDSFVKIH